MNDRRHGWRCVLLIPCLVGLAAFAWAIGARRPAAAIPTLTRQPISTAEEHRQLAAVGKELFRNVSTFLGQVDRGFAVFW